MKPCSRCRYAALCLMHGGPSLDALEWTLGDILHAQGLSYASHAQYSEAVWYFDHTRPKNCPGAKMIK
jgi:hypothetical protein